LWLKSINSTQSAYASMFLTKEFFTETDTHILHKDDYNLCRISMKSALAVLRPSPFQQRNVVNNKLSCIIQINPRADYMILKIGQVYNIAKCYVVSLRDCTDTYRNLFTDKSKLANRIKLQARILLDVLTLIGGENDVLKLVAAPNHFTVERFIALEQDRSVKRKTAAMIDPGTFNLYDIKHPTEVAIKVKELRAVLQFADGCGKIVSLHFQQPERPVIVSFRDDVEFVAEFVLATFDCVTTATLGDREVDVNLINRGTQPLSQQQDRRHGVFDLIQDTPNSSCIDFSKTILCPESADENDENTF